VQCEGVILSYRLGRRAQHPRECLIRVLGSAEVGGMIGWKVAWPAEAPTIHGVIVGMHGRKGILRVRFRRGVPGQAMNDRIKIYQ